MLPLAMFGGVESINNGSAAAAVADDADVGADVAAADVGICFESKTVYLE